LILTAYFSIIFGPPGCSDALVNSFELTWEGGTWFGHTRKEFRNIICFALDSRQPDCPFATALLTCTITQQLSLELCFAISSPVKGILLA